MSDVVPHKQALRHRAHLRYFRQIPKRVLFAPEESARVFFGNETSGRATCLGCHDIPCIELSEGELGIGGDMSEFPGHPLRDVCPTNAISWNAETNSPSIDSSSCVGCGLCAERCPYGAISLTDRGIAAVEASDPDELTAPTNNDGDPGYMVPEKNIRRRGAIGSPRSAFVRRLPEILHGMTDNQAAVLTRNLFIAIAVAASMRRKGDTNVRMDGLVRFASGQIGVFELETGPAVLETPRALLEDIAIMHGRFGLELSDIVPISVISSLPNVRAEYYQVIEDIEKVLGVRCRTLTLGSLCMLAWSFSEVYELKDSMFMTAPGNTDLYRAMDLFCDSLVDEEPYPGAYRPIK